jgi:hypothetical protein
MFPHAYPIELIQLELAVLGLAFNLWGWSDAWRDRRLVLRSVATLTFERDIISKKRIYTETLVLLLQIIFIIVGALGVIYPPPPWAAHVPPDVIARVAIYRGLYLAGTACLVGITAVGRWMRFRLA